MEFIFFGKERKWQKYELEKHYNTTLKKLQDDVWLTDPLTSYYDKIHVEQNISAQEMDYLNLKVDTNVTKLPKADVLSEYLQLCDELAWETSTYVEVRNERYIAQLEALTRNIREFKDGE